MSTVCRSIATADHYVRMQRGLAFLQSEVARHRRYLDLLIESGSRDTFSGRRRRHWSILPKSLREIFKVWSIRPCEFPFLRPMCASSRMKTAVARKECATYDCPWQGRAAPSERAARLNVNSQPAKSKPRARFLRLDRLTSVLPVIHPTTGFRPATAESMQIAQVFISNYS